MLLTNTGLLLSGGLDSIAIAFWKRPAMAFSIDYGQRPAEAEIHASAQVASALGIKHYVIKVDCATLGSGDLNGQSPSPFAPAKEWWPFRNQLLVTLACMKGIDLGLKELYVGSVSTDRFHIDGSRVFYDTISLLTQMQEGNIAVSCPASDLTTVQLIKESKIPISLLRWAHSCHVGDIPCMNCNGCRKHLATIQELEFSNEESSSQKGA